MKNGVLESFYLFNSIRVSVLHRWLDALIDH